MVLFLVLYTKEEKWTNKVPRYLIMIIMMKLKYILGCELLQFRVQEI
jgi:hypothetical protein